MADHPNKALVRRFFDEVFNRQSRAAAAEILSEDFVAHHPAFPDGLRGPEAIMEMTAMFRAGFPDLQYRIERLVAEDDLVVARWSARATHRGPFMGVPPTGKTISVTGMDMFRVAEGRCAETWVNSDFLGLLQQIGAVPAPQPEDGR